MIASYYIIYTNHFDRADIKATICKINCFSIVTSTCPKYILKLSCAKKLLRKNLGLVNLKIEKVKFFTRGPTKIFALAFLTLEVA